ncbi:MAG TPA: DUF1611 domain-containing protein [Cyanobacteria bacterium UBA11149]|nr:DUF1611 domain-containing protein [Cyanobacteria bacterium UBA11367]HBE58868.1 DUF1611 domain-containing protein [Cyanobacteria bacterium UBA11366]HBK66427.1 DUF1611 domain-containing protein [Cyanobacteria bacterium UBA11166]HBR74705.1 DUF1611 domain-containing protein [Cyanobacteria bacterium UBA11159]HBS70182.1 DUF1611 domain-containing protein [Cyanobacteria bacterium UBA11153]HBW89919.1 DUF1611 domain-containing protein [Cyanobacteria bacterium UBA11149]HCA95593.1 DUF1611 domain-conta
MAIVKETALVYCENQFGLVDGKTATGLIRHSELYNIVGVIDSSLSGKDAGEELGEAKNNIPIFASLDEALSKLSEVPDCYIYGKAPLEACLSNEERFLILEAMAKGMDIINGLHQFFSEDPEFVNMAVQHGIQIKDIRKPPQVKDLHVFTGEISEVNIPVIAVLGTDCACGKMTTAVELNKALNNLGIKSILVATGQTSLMQGAMYGVSIDALISQFVIGEIENSVIQAFDNEKPDIILVEGQSAVSHPAFMSSLGILKGSMPDGIILQHPPGRKFRCDFPNLVMPTVESEIKLIEAISQARVIAIALSHENLAEVEILKIIKDYEQQFQLPTTDVLTYGCQKIVETLSNHFPKLKQKIKYSSLEKIPVLAMK